MNTHTQNTLFYIKFEECTPSRAVQIRFRWCFAWDRMLSNRNEVRKRKIVRKNNVVFRLSKRTRWNQEKTFSFKSFSTSNNNFRKTLTVIASWKNHGNATNQSKRIHWDNRVLREFYPSIRKRKPQNSIENKKKMCVSLELIVKLFVLQIVIVIFCIYKKIINKRR